MDTSVSWDLVKNTIMSVNFQRRSCSEVKKDKKRAQKIPELSRKCLLGNSWFNLRVGGDVFLSFCFKEFPLNPASSSTKFELAVVELVRTTADTDSQHFYVPFSCPF